MIWIGLWVALSFLFSAFFSWIKRRRRTQDNPSEEEFELKLIETVESEFKELDDAGLIPAIFYMEREEFVKTVVELTKQGKIKPGLLNRINWEKMK